MRRKYIVALTFALAFRVSAWAADDGAKLYKTKCSQCHRRPKAKARQG